MIIKTIGWLLVVVLTVVSIGSFAQTRTQPERRPRFPAWVSEKGYWVIESNINSPLDHVITFFNNDNKMIYKEAVTGVKINPGKRKVKMKLKKILETAVVAHESKQAASLAGNETALVRSVFK